MPDLSSVARMAAEREYPLPDDLSPTSRTLRLVAREHFANGFTECASRLPSEEELEFRFREMTVVSQREHGEDPALHEFARAVLALTGEKISSES